MKRRLVIELYGHTSVTEVAELLETLKEVGIDNVKYECDDPKHQAATITHLRTVFGVKIS